jgi:hypothetical protein
MPTNVTPEYKKAEEAYRSAREARDGLHLPTTDTRIFSLAVGVL